MRKSGLVMIAVGGICLFPPLLKYVSKKLGTLEIKTEKVVTFWDYIWKINRVNTKRVIKYQVNSRGDVQKELSVSLDNMDCDVSWDKTFMEQIRSLPKIEASPEQRWSYDNKILTTTELIKIPFYCRGCVIQKNGQFYFNAKSISSDPNKLITEYQGYIHNHLMFLGYGLIFTGYCII